jgi:hypothetical protein
LTTATGNSTYSLSFGYTHYGSNGQYGNMRCTGTQACISLSFSASTNRITTSNYTYDASGHLTCDGTRLPVATEISVAGPIALPGPPVKVRLSA